MNLAKALKFMKVAEAVASFSKDPSTQVGAVAIDNDYNVLSVGYNGLPRGVVDLPSRLERPLKYSLIVHAEANLVTAAARKGVGLMGATVLVTSLFPCSNCAGLLIQAGIKRIITTRTDNERWVENASLSEMMFNEARVEVYYIKKNEAGEWIYEIPQQQVPQNPIQVLYPQTEP